MDKNWPNSVRYNVHRIYFTGVVSCLFYCIWEYVCVNVLICAAKKLHYYITYPTTDAEKDIALKLYGPFQHEICIKGCCRMTHIRPIYATYTILARKMTDPKTKSGFECLLIYRSKYM